jgi:phenylalanine ammonia-lyase
MRLQAKEGLGITNGTAPSCAAACLVMHEANRLALLVQLLTAMATEALSGTAHNYDPFISEVRPHAGQAEAAANILRFLSGSQLSPYSSSYATAQKRIGLAQDRYALRTAPQWIGPQLEDLALATTQVATELNATTDNPLIDVAGSTIHHGGNFQAMALTSAMDKTLAALQNLGRLLFAQASEMINNSTSHGLPPNLAADDPSASFTAKGFDVNMAAYAAELAYLARGPVSACMQPAEMANQSVNSMALVAARYAAEAVEVLSLMAATYIWILCQALDLRCLRVEFGRAVEREVSRVIRLSLLADLTFVDLVKDLVRYDEFLRFVTEVTEAVLQRWDQLSHLDLRDRSKMAANESLGPVLECIAKYRDTVGDLRLEKIPDYQKLMAEMLEKRYNDIRAQFFRGQLTAATYISPASRVVFAWVRKDLKIPFHRGLEDHPTLLLRKAEGAQACNGDGVQDDGANGVVQPDEELLARGRTLGTMASDIYEAMRRGELHDRIMKFGEDAGLWR